MATGRRARENDARPAARGVADRRAGILAAVLLALPVPLCTLIFIAERPPITRWGYVGIEGFTYRTDYNNVLLGLLALATALAIVARAFLRDTLPRLAFVMPLAMVLLGGVLYFYGSRVARMHYPWFHDSYHYLLGAKYFAEVGYDRLYECHLAADAERPKRRYAPDAPVTDLRRDTRSTAAAVANRADCGGFSPARWAEFQRDTAFFDGVAEPDILRDRGYNGSPFHTLLASRLANWVPLSYEAILSWTFVDIVALCVLMATVAWAFGWRLGCLFALFVFTNFSDRFNFIGASFLRYLWLVGLGAGIAMMKAKRYGASAALMSGAAMLNVFPLLFFAGIAVKAAAQLARRRRLDAPYRRFIAAAAVASSALGLLSLAQPHPLRTYADFFDGMRRHSQAITSMRVGFQYNFVPRGESDGPAGERPGPAYYAVTAVALAAVLFVIARSDDVAATVLGGVSLLFLLFSTATYYYACAAFLVLLEHGPPGSRARTIFPALLFAATAAVYALWYLSENDLAFLNNTVISVMMTAYLAAVFAYETARLGRPLREPA